MRTRRKGYGELAAALIVIPIILSLVVYSLYLSSDQEKGRKLSDIMRQYVIVMESNGCLTPVEQQSLIMELEQCGASEIVFHSNPLNKVAYGEEVSLAISGKIDINAIVAYEDWGFVQQEGGGTFQKVMKSTAQY